MHAFREVSDGSLGDAILEVGIYPTEGELLPCVVACLSEGVVMEVSVVAMVVQDFDSVFCHVLFEGRLNGKCFVGLAVELELYKLKVAVVVDKDNSKLVALLGEFAFQSCIKSHFRCHHLVDQDTLSRFGCNKDLMVGLGFIALTRKLCHCTKNAACTFGRQHLGKLLWDLAVEGKLLKLGEAQVTKAVMPLHELGLIVSGRKLDVFGFLCWS